MRERGWVSRARPLHRRWPTADDLHSIETCMDYDCVNSYIDEFTATADAPTDPATLNFASVASEINSLQSGLTSLGVTLTSFLPIPTGSNLRSIALNTQSGPYVPDISSAYAAYTSTRTAIGTSGGGFTFDTASFLSTQSEAAAAATSSTEEAAAAAAASSGSTSVALVTVTQGASGSTVTSVVAPTGGTVTQAPTPTNAGVASTGLPASSLRADGAVLGAGAWGGAVAVLVGVLGL